MCDKLHLRFLINLTSHPLILPSTGVPREREQARSGDICGWIAFRRVRPVNDDGSMRRHDDVVGMKVSVTKPFASRDK